MVAVEETAVHVHVYARRAETAVYYNSAVEFSFSVETVCFWGTAACVWKYSPAEGARCAISFPESKLEFVGQQCHQGATTQSTHVFLII